ncbi:unnamed protein product, partial [Rhizoctonia solani]
MPTTRSQAKRARLPDTGQRVGINRLPPELLSTIFVTCVLLDEYNTFIVPPWHSAKRCLARARPTALLDIDLDLETVLDDDSDSDYWANHEADSLDSLAEKAEDVLNFIFNHG